MNHIIKRLALGAVLIGIAMTGACKRGVASSLQAQSNTSLTFHGLVVDQDGQPLEGAIFKFRVEAYPTDWTYDTRGRPNDASSTTIVSDVHGRFELPVTGCQLICVDASRPGYRQFCDLDPSDGAVQTRSFGLISWGQVQYKADPSNPAVFVFVRVGTKEMKALPNRGGFHAYGKQWIANTPAWPKQPSLTDVVRKAMSSAP